MTLAIALAVLALVLLAAAGYPGERRLAEMGLGVSAVVVAAIAATAQAGAVAEPHATTRTPAQDVLTFEYTPAQDAAEYLGDVVAVVRPGLDVRDCFAWEDHIDRAAREWGVPSEVMWAVLVEESTCAPPGSLITSSAGAVCAFQIMPRERGFPGRPARAELADPDTCAGWSARILRENWESARDVFDAIRRYNGAGREAEMYARRVLGTAVALRWGAVVRVPGTPGVGFGAPITWQTTGWHTGADVFTPYGTPLAAPTDGVVSYVAAMGCTPGVNCDRAGLGANVVAVRIGAVATANGARPVHLLWAHNSRALVSPGDIVRAGDVVALSGNDGYSRPPALEHVHIEVVIADDVQGGRWTAPVYLAPVVKERRKK